MPVFRVERNKGYTVMSNYHLRDKSLSLKAKGLLSQILKTYGAENPPLKNAISRLVQPCYGVFGVIIGAV